MRNFKIMEKQYWKDNQEGEQQIKCSRMANFDREFHTLGLVRCENDSIGSYLESSLVNGHFHYVLIFFCQEHDLDEV